MALQLKQFFLQREYNDVYVNIDVVNATSDGKANVFLSYWDSDKKENKFWGDRYEIPFDKKAEANIYSLAYNELKKLPEFKDALDV